MVDRLLGLKCVKSHCISLHAAICTMYVRLVVFVDAFRGKATSLSVSLSPRFRLGTKGNVSADAKMLAMLSFSCPSLTGVLQFGKLVVQFHPREKSSGCICATHACHGEVGDHGEVRHGYGVELNGESGDTSRCLAEEILCSFLPSFSTMPRQFVSLSKRAPSSDYSDSS